MHGFNLLANLLTRFNNRDQFVLLLGVAQAMIKVILYKYKFQFEYVSNTQFSTVIAPAILLKKRKKQQSD